MCSIIIPYIFGSLLEVTCCRTAASPPPSQMCKNMPLWHRYASDIGETFSLAGNIQPNLMMESLILRVSGASVRRMSQWIKAASLLYQKLTRLYVCNNEQNSSGAFLFLEPIKPLCVAIPLLTTRGHIPTYHRRLPPNASRFSLTCTLKCLNFSPEIN